MLILYDMQKEFASLSDGVFTGMKHLVPVGDPPPVLMLETIEDVKSVSVTKRAAREAGVGIPLAAFPGIQKGDRITVTGRIAKGGVSGSWGIALSLDEAESGRQALAYQAAPKPLFALSSLLDESDLGRTLLVHTVSLGQANPVTDFNIDNILVSRRDRTAYGAEIDSRGTIYTLEDDHGINISDEDTQIFSNSRFLNRSGTPVIKFFRRGNAYAFHIGGRSDAADGLDINLERFGLLPGNNYQVTVTGRIDGPSPHDARIMLQGLPGLECHSPLHMKDNKEFTLTYAVNPPETELSGVRVATNAAGSAVSFYVYSIEIIRT